jgi:hypothetical protein
MELPADVRALLEAPNYAHLATILPGDGPHTVPVWAGIEDGKVATPSAVSRVSSLASSRDGKSCRRSDLVRSDDACLTEGAPSERYGRGRTRQ